MLPKSETLYIFEGTGMPNVRVRNSAEFVAVSRDRVRFHLAVSNRSEKVWLEDERGRRYEPVREAARVERLFHPRWRIPRDPKCPFCTHFHDVWLRYETADYVVDVPGIIGPERRALVLHVVRPGIFRPLRFSWTFGDDLDVPHHDAARAAEIRGIVTIPDADTMVRSSEADAETFRYLDRPDRG